MEWIPGHCRPVSIPFVRPWRRSGAGRVLSLAACLLLSSARAADHGPERIPLWNGPAPVGDGSVDAANAWITLHRPPVERASAAAFVICPGGGYGGLVVEPEGHGIAQWLITQGVAGIVLEYRLPAGRPRVPLLDAQRAIRTVRSRAAEWGIDPARVGIIGFSAGGHLASTAATQFDGGDPAAVDPVQRLSCRPDFAVLVYPVITMGEKGHGGSRARLLGDHPSDELQARFSGERQVTPQTPPTFLVHAVDDAVVPVDNSRAMYEALRAQGVACDYLELPRGGHGLNRYQGPMWDAWQRRALEWLAEQGIHRP